MESLRVRKARRSELSPASAFRRHARTIAFTFSPVSSSPSHWRPSDGATSGHGIGWPATERPRRISRRKPIRAERAIALPRFAERGELRRAMREALCLGCDYPRAGGADRASCSPRALRACRRLRQHACAMTKAGHWPAVARANGAAPRPYRPRWHGDRLVAGPMALLPPRGWRSTDLLCARDELRQERRAR
jgi:hypothetical protein